MKISKNSAEHYVWGKICDGWHLVKTAGMSVIHEKMPPDTAEVRHFHQKARQFFFVLAGQATLEVDGEVFLLDEHEGIEIAPQVPHQMMNASAGATEFIVVSVPTSKGDRVTQPHR